jgi:hypothetical protein
VGVSLTFTDEQFTLAPLFMDFLYRHFRGGFADQRWHDQLSEGLNNDDNVIRTATEHAVEMMNDVNAQKAVLRSYELFSAFLTGNAEQLKSFHYCYKFICVVGAPRHGGSYLTKELFCALGHAAKDVPNAIAHDGFPDATPFDFDQGYSAYTRMMHNMAEYLTMVELYFANSRTYDNKIQIPKKATKAAYQGGFFDRVLGPDAEYLITLRHPVPACISTYEKSGGLPADGRFAVRGNIETWVRRDNLYAGISAEKVGQLDYFDAYLNYWEHYHYNLLLTGLRLNPKWQIVAYGKERLEGMARSLRERFGNADAPESFKVSDQRNRHPEWMRQAEPVVRRVADVWNRVGVPFPFDTVMEAW